MGGGNKWKKTKWRTFRPDSASVGQSTQPKQRQERNVSNASENIPQPEELQQTTECPFEDGYRYGYGYPQGINYPHPSVAFYNPFVMPFYPNFMVPSDMMYNQFYVQPPPSDGTVPEDSVPMYPLQMYTPPQVPEYTPSNLVPTVPDVPLEDYMHAPDAQDPNPGDQGNDLNNPPCQGCAESGMQQGQYAQEYNMMPLPTPRDPVCYIYPGQQVYPYHAHHSSLNSDWRSRRRRRPYNGYRHNSFRTTRQNEYGDEEERYGSTVLRIKPKSGMSAKTSNLDKTMNPEANNLNGEDSKKIEGADQPLSAQDISSGNMNSTNDKNGNRKTHMNQKNSRKTEFCGTHTKQNPEKSESATNNYKSKPFKLQTTLVTRTYQGPSTEVSKSEDGDKMKSEKNLNEKPIDVSATAEKSFEDSENNRQNCLNENIQQGEEDINIHKSSTLQASFNYSKNLKDMQNSDLKITAKDSIGEKSPQKNIEMNESSATFNNGAARDTGIKTYNTETDKSKVVQENIANELIDLQPISCDLKEIVIDNKDEQSKVDENLAVVEQNCVKGSDLIAQHSFKNNTKNQEENVPQNQLFIHNSLGMVNKITGPVPKILNTTSRASPPKSSPELKENNIDAKMVSLNSFSSMHLNSISNNTVSSKKETSSSELGERIASAQTNSFDEKLLQNKKLIKPEGLFITPKMEYNIKYDEEVQYPPPISQSMKSNQSLYKISFNESIDSSETNSRSSLSPVDPESQVPSSIVNDEIIVHEADTDSDAGSEDVELIAHRYECETSLNRSKNVYVNKLSLAVELLRTQESLPYDAHFKRVVDDNDPSEENATGEINLGFEDDSTQFNTPGQGKVVTTSPTKSNKFPGASTSSTNNNELTDSCKEAKEKASTDEKRDNTEEVKAVNRRFQIHFRHYFAPRGSLINPCLCCILM